MNDSLESLPRLCWQTGDDIYITGLPQKCSRRDSTHGDYNGGNCQFTAETAQCTIKPDALTVGGEDILPTCKGQVN